MPQDFFGRALLTGAAGVLFALGVPEHFTNQHLMLLSQLAELFSDPDFTQRLRQAPDSASLYALLSDWQLTHAAA